MTNTMIITITITFILLLQPRPPQHMIPLPSGAPRLLQSIAKDDVIPILAPFAKVTKSNEPLLGLVLTAVIAEMAILLGAVDKIAEVLDFFFLMCYAFVNLIACLHSILGAPNWRPRFKYFHWLVDCRKIVEQLIKGLFR